MLPTRATIGDLAALWKKHRGVSLRRFRAVILL
jgi:hypothetical protein